MTDTLFQIFICLMVAGVVLVAYSLCNSARKSDDIAEKYWDEYWEKKNEKEKTNDDGN